MKGVLLPGMPAWVSNWISDMTLLQIAVQLAHTKELEVTVHPGTGSTMIDSMRWDYWLRLHNREVTMFRGRTAVKVL